MGQKFNKVFTKRLQGIASKGKAGPTMQEIAEEEEQN